MVGRVGDTRKRLKAPKGLSGGRRCTEAPARGETGRLPEYVLIGGGEVRPMIGPRPLVEAS